MWTLQMYDAMACWDCDEEATLEFVTQEYDLGDRRVVIQGVPVYRCVHGHENMSLHTKAAMERILGKIIKAYPEREFIKLQWHKLPNITDTVDAQTKAEFHLELAAAR